MKCQSCHQDVSDHSKFCNLCGAKLVRQEKICPNPECQRGGLPEEAVFCPDCGTQLSLGKPINRTPFILGIDFGSTNTRLSVFKDGKPFVLPAALGETFMPSVAAITQNGGTLFGTPAQRQATTNPINTVYSVKRCIGESYSSLTRETKTVPYCISHDEIDRIQIEINEYKYFPHEISAVILREAKRIAEVFLGQELSDAVITVPDCFNVAQRRATIEAGKMAGLKVRTLINETTAAALAYGFDKWQRDITLAILHLGGGTFDFSIIEIGDGVFEVKSTCGDSQLGGDDFDQAIINYLADEMYKDGGKDILLDRWTIPRLKEVAERAKIELSSSTLSEINLPYLATVNGISKHLIKTLSREKFEQLSGRLIRNMMECCNKTLKNAGLSPYAIDEIILVGNSTRIPVVREKIQQLFGKSPSAKVNPDEFVATGAAIMAGVLSGEVKDLLLLEVLSESIGIETDGGVMSEIIKSNTTIPTIKKEIFSTATDNQQSVEIHVLQGTHSMAKKNRTIGRFHLDGITIGKRGEPQIEVVF
jgi:molecular chaperone DnaK